MTKAEINTRIATDVMGWRIATTGFEDRQGASRWFDGEHFRKYAYEWRPATDANHLMRAEASLNKRQRVLYDAALSKRLVAVPVNQQGWYIRQLPLRTCCEALLEAVKIWNDRKASE